MTALSWNAVEQHTDRLSDKIARAACAPNLIVGVARGGFVPARLLTNRLNVRRLTSIGVWYPGPGRTDPEFYSVPTPISGDDRILLVEDVLESGQSLAAARDFLAGTGAMVWTAAYFYVTGCGVRLDFSLGPVDSPPTFPWD